MRADPKMVTAGPILESVSNPSTNSPMIRKIRQGSSAALGWGWSTWAWAGWIRGPAFVFFFTARQSSEISDAALADLTCKVSAMESTEARRILDEALSRVKADEAEAVLAVEASASTRFSNNVITQNLVRREATVRIRAAFGNRVGSAATNRLDAEGLAETARRACEIARSAPPDLEFMPGLPPQAYPRIDAFAPATASLTPRGKAERLLPVFEAARAAGVLMAGSHHTAETAVFLANSRGLRAEHRGTLANFSNTAITDTSSGWSESVGTDVDRLDLAGAARTAIDKALAAREPRSLAPGAYPAVVAAPGLLDLLRFMFWMMDAKAAAEGRSFASGKLGERLAGPNVTIRSVPNRPGCPGRPFTDDGLPCETVPWIDGGVLRNLVTSRWWAQEHGLRPVGRPTNLVMDGGSGSAEDLARGMKRGLLVTRFWYIRYVEPMSLMLTGMTRDGLFWVEDGRVAHAVKNFRWNESLLSVLNRIEALGAPRVTAGTEGETLCAVPDVRLSEFNFASATEF